MGYCVQLHNDKRLNQSTGHKGYIVSAPWAGREHRMGGSVCRGSTIHKIMCVLLLASNLVVYHLSPCDFMTWLEEIEADRESVPGVLLELWYCGGKSKQLNIQKIHYWRCISVRYSQCQSKEMEIFPHMPTMRSSAFHHLCLRFKLPLLSRKNVI